MKKAILLIKRLFISIAIPLVLFVILLIAVPERVGVNTLGQLFQQGIAPTLLAWGVFFALKVGVWDFSAGAVIMFAGIVGGNISNMLGWGIPGVLLFCPLIGMAMGLVTGTLFRLLKIPSIVVSVGMMLIVESICSKIFDGGGVLMSSDIYAVGMFPMNIIILVVGFMIIFYLLNLSKFGYHVRAVGKGISIAMMNGIKIDKVRTLCFMITGFFAGGYAIMQLGSSGVVLPKTNMASMSPVFDAVICVFIANTLERTINPAIGVVIGAVTVQIIKIGIIVLGFTTMYQQVIISLFLLLFMAMDTRGPAIKNMILKKLVRDHGHGKSFSAE